MSKVIIEEDTLIGIADAIRTKKGTSDLIPTPNMKSEILSISGGGEVSHREVSSIIADGSSYIKSDIYPTPYYSIEMECKAHTIVDNHFDFLFGTRYGSLGYWCARFNKVSDDNGIVRFNRSKYYDGAYDTWINTSCTRESDYKTFKMSKREVYIDNELIGTFGTSSSHQYAHYPFQLYIFANNDTDDIGGNPLISSGYIDCKYVKIWDANDNLIMHLIPVVKTDGTVCMFDKVNSRYYYNAGTGSFSYSE